MFEQEFAEKGIRVRGPDKTRDDKVLVRTVMVRIEGARRDSNGSSASANHVWLTTRGNRQDYAIGDAIEAVFGAGQDGWIHLYVVEPNGRYSRLKSYAVKENQTYRAKAVAADPAGKHALVAVYSEDDKPGRAPSSNGIEKGLSLLDAAPKGVELVDDAPAADGCVPIPHLRRVSAEPCHITAHPPVAARQTRRAQACRCPFAVRPRRQRRPRLAAPQGKTWL